MSISLSARRWSGPSRILAFTLVETLLAVSIAAALSGLAGMIAVQSQHSARAVKAKLDEQWAHHQVLHQFRADIVQRVTWLAEPSKILELPQKGEELLTVITLAEFAEPGAMTRRRFPTRVRWLVRKNTDLQTLALVREARDLTRAGAVSETLVTDLREVRVDVFVNGQWLTPTSPDASGLQQSEDWAAIRLTASWTDERGGATLQRTVLLRRGAANARRGS